MMTTTYMGKNNLDQLEVLICESLDFETYGFEKTAVFAVAVDLNYSFGKLVDLTQIYGFSFLISWLYLLTLMAVERLIVD